MEGIYLARQRADEWCETFNNIYIDGQKCPIFLFSDSIAIFSPDYEQVNDFTDLSGFLTVVLYVKMIIQSFIVRQFPIRGVDIF